MTTPPATLIRTHADLEAFWRHLMEPLGFARRALWIAFLADDGEVPPSIVEISDMPRLPDQESRDGLSRLMAGLREDAGIVRFAFLLARPGRGGAGHDDRAWAAALHTAASRAGARCELVHLATDTDLLPLPLDDLALTPVTAG